jgi:WD40 repeat protein
MTSRYDELLAKHQALQQEEHAEPTPERIERVRAFIVETVEAGRSIPEPRQREQLRGLLRYWSAWVYDRTKEYPQAQLSPALVAFTKAEEGRRTAIQVLGGERNAAIAGGVILLLVVVGVLWAFAQLAVGAPPSSPTPDLTGTVAAGLEIVQATEFSLTEISIQATLTAIARPTDTPEVVLETSLPPTPIPPTSTPIPTATPVRQEAGYKFTLSGNTDTVLAVDFSPDGQTLASGSRDGFVRVWEVAAQSERSAVQVNAILALKFDPQGRFFATGGFGGVLGFWDAQACLGDLRSDACQPQYDQRNIAGDLWGIAFTSDGQVMATGSTPETTGNTLPTLRLWDVEGRYNSPVLINYIDPIVSVGLTPDGTQLISGGTNGELRAWDVVTGKLIRRWNAHAGVIWSLAVSPDGQRVVSAGQDGAIRLWEIASGRQIAIYEPPDKERPILYSVAYSPDANLIASGGADNAVRFWNAADLTSLVEPLMGHTGSIRAVAFSPDGKSLASGSADKTIIVWAVPEAP